MLQQEVIKNMLQSGGLQPLPPWIRHCSPTQSEMSTVFGPLLGGICFCGRMGGFSGCLLSKTKDYNTIASAMTLLSAAF